MVEDWLANAYDGMSRREFLAKVGVAGVGLAGFAIAATPVAGKVITTASEGLIRRRRHGALRRVSGSHL